MMRHANSDLRRDGEHTATDSFFAVYSYSSEVEEDSVSLSLVSEELALSSSLSF